MVGTFCGHSDPPINATGRELIGDLTTRLADESFDAIYCSDLLRAVGTAQVLAQAFDAPVTTMHELREIYFGEWDGLTWAEVETRDAIYARRWIESYPDLPAPGGETFADFESRVLAAVDDLLEIAQARQIAVVAHGGVLRVILRRLLGCSKEQAFDKTKSYCCSFDYGNDIAIREVS